jgi:NADH dehydrogenase FAD-containing subunit
MYNTLFGVKPTTDDEAAPKVVVIVGGGYAGVRVAKDLDASGSMFRVVLLDRKDYFLNNIAGVPAAVQTGYADSMCIPYDKLFSSLPSKKNKSTFLQAEVTEIQKDRILVRGQDEPLYFDYCIIATGSSYAFPFKIADTSLGDAQKRFAKLPEYIAQAEHVVVAGGGAVGCEMAGEIATCYNNTSSDSGS